MIRSMVRLLVVFLFKVYCWDKICLVRVIKLVVGGLRLVLRVVWGVVIFGSVWGFFCGWVKGKVVGRWKEVVEKCL